jgi:hypothetical protein
MAKKLYTVDYTDESYPQVVEATEVERGVTLLEAKDELYRWAAGQAEHFRMVARAAIAARKEDVDAGSIYTERAELTAKRERARGQRVEAPPVEAREDAFVEIDLLLAS